MPNGATDDLDTPRIVVDETSFDFRSLTLEQLEDNLDLFNEALGELLHSEHTVATSPFCVEYECRDATTLSEFLFSPNPDVGRDTRLRCGILLERCPDWDEWVKDACTTVSLDGEPARDAYTIGFALTMTTRGRAAACLMFPNGRSAGWSPVHGDVGQESVFFFADAARLPWFWRGLFASEAKDEHAFFSLAREAFPELCLHPDLTFRRFDGGYVILRDHLVRVLAALNDHFGHALAEHQGIPHNVQAAMGQHGVDLSPESPNTRTSERLMRLRDVDFEGVTYRCEWHAKLERHRNRVHFTLPAMGPSGRILVGLFIDHLDT